MNWRVFFVAVALLVGGLGMFVAWSEFCLCMADRLGRHVGYVLFMGTYVLAFGAWAGLSDGGKSSGK